MTTKDKCPACGKKMKLICPYEWTMKDERAFKLGEKSQKQKIIEEIEEILRKPFNFHPEITWEMRYRELLKDIQELLKSLGEKE